MKIAPAVSFLSIAVLVGACSSSDKEEEPATTQPATAETRVEVEGMYKREEGGGGGGGGGGGASSTNIEFVVFESKGQYKMAIDGAPRLDEGTYAFNDAKTSVTFHSNTEAGRETKFDLAVGEASSTVGDESSLLKPKAGLVNPGAGLVRAAGSVQLNGQGYQLVAFDYFCKDARLISPNSSNCSGVQGNCAAGMVTCIQYGPRRS